MKRYIAFLTIVLALAACKKAQPTGEQYQPAPVLETSTGTVQFSSEGGKSVVSASTYDALTAKSNQEWLTLKVQGHDIELTAEPNTSIEIRYATLSLQSGDALGEVIIVQFGYNTKYLWQEGYNFAGAGGVLNLRYANTDATIRVKVSDNWISAAASDGILTITVAENPESEPREGSIEWIAGDDNRTIVITQAKGSAGGGGGGNGPVIFSEDFESVDNLAEWMLLDLDGDDNTWGYADFLAAHSGIGIIFSQSYDNDSGPLTPDNWVITPGVQVTSDNYVSFWVTGQDPSYASEHYGVYVGTVLPSTAADLNAYQNIFEATNPVSDPYEEEVIVFESANGPKDMVWQRIAVKIPASYDNKTVYFAFRHFDCTDMYFLNLDDVMVTAGLPEKTASAYASVPSSMPALNYNNQFAFYKKVK
jgi:hypothetical protein